MNNENTLIVQYQTTLRLNQLQLYSINVKHQTQSFFLIPLIPWGTNTENE